MLKWLAILVFAVIVAVSAMELMAAQKNTTTQDNAWERNQLLPTINKSNNCVPAQQKEGSADSVQGWHKFVTWPESITAWALIFTFFAIASQACLMRVHARHLRSLAEHIVTSERAWVQVSKLTLTSGSIDHPQGRNQVFVSCGCINYGKTPARVLGLNVLLTQSPINNPESAWNKSLYDFSGKITPKWIIAPNIPKHVYETIQGFTANPDDELPPPSAGNAYFIHGVLRYWDAFSETDRFTRFCYREDRGGSRLGKGWHIAGAERCNQET
jgi:hypothetical protein